MKRLLCALPLALVVTAVPAPVSGQGVYSADASRIQPAGPRVAKPLSRDKLNGAVAEIFKGGDTNRDGLITLDEFNAAIAELRSKAIRERFAAIDTNRDQQLSFAEFSQWQASLGSAVLSESQAGGSIALVAEELPFNLGRSAEDEALEQLLRPISATAIIEANTDYDAGISLAELLAWELAFFDAGDTNKDGWLTPDEYALLIEARGAR